MKRKRFIKLLMSHGEPVKNARKIAIVCNSLKIPYKEAYYNYFLAKTIRTNEQIANAFSQLANSIEVFKNSFLAMWTFLKKAWQNFRKYDHPTEKGGAEE